VAITDTRITDWTSTTGNNPPDDDDLIGPDLGGHFRNIKAVVREDIDKGFTHRQPDTYEVVNISYAKNKVARHYGEYPTLGPVLNRNSVQNRTLSKFGQDFVIVIKDSEAYKSFSSFTPFTLFTEFEYRDVAGAGGTVWDNLAKSKAFAAHRAVVIRSGIIGSGDVGAVFPTPGFVQTNTAFTLEELRDRYDGYSIVYGALPLVDVMTHPRTKGLTDDGVTYPRLGIESFTFFGVQVPYPFLEILTTGPNSTDDILQVAGISRTASQAYNTGDTVDLILEECVLKVVNSGVVENRIVTRNMYQSTGLSTSSEVEIGGTSYTKTKIQLQNYLEVPLGHNEKGSTWIIDGNLNETYYRSPPTSAIYGDEAHSLRGSDPTYTLEETRLYWLNADNRPSSQFNDLGTTPAVHQSYIVTASGLLGSRVEVDSCGGGPISSPGSVNSICGEGQITGDGDSGPYYIDVFDSANSWQTFYSYIQRELDAGAGYDVYEPKCHFQLLSTTASPSDDVYEGSDTEETLENYTLGHTARVAPITLDEEGEPDSTTYSRGFRLKVYFGFPVPVGKVLKLAYMLLWPYALDKNQEP
jgi:hypothetical protein